MRMRALASDAGCQWRRTPSERISAVKAAACAGGAPDADQAGLDGPAVRPRRLRSSTVYVTSWGGPLVRVAGRWSVKSASASGANFASPAGSHGFFATLRQI